MEICQHQGYGIPTWGPSQKLKNLLATGTYYESKDQEQSLLRISKYDINSQSGLVMQGVTQSPTKFASLDWIDFKDDFGIIAGGMEDGAITLWDPKKILDGQSTMDTLKLGKGCLSANKIHNGVSVRSIEFNPHKKNLLASGGSEVFIQDLSANMKTPNVFKPGVPNYHEGSNITSISWNRVVPHILASASENGKIVVWDLKGNKPIFNFTEPSSNQGGMDYYFGAQDQTPQTTQVRQTQMMWNPLDPTQFVVANDDDSNSSINIWDLRRPDYPCCTFSDIHAGGILSFSWCLSDPSLVISSGNDNRSVVTNFKTGEQVLEFPTQSHFQNIKWSNNLHGKVCTMNEEGTTSVLSFEPEGLFSNPNRKYATPNISQQTNEPFMPKWVQPKCGARFGFGNRLVTFNMKSKGLVSIHQKGTNDNLAQKVTEFDNMLQNLPMSQICDIKSKNSQNDYDMMEFKVLKCLIDENYDDLLKQFGIDKNKAVFEVERFLGRKLNRPQENTQEVSKKPVQNNVLQSNLPELTAQGAADFFSQLGEQKQPEPKQASQTSASSMDQNQNNRMPGSSTEIDSRAESSRQNLIQETVSRNTNWDESTEGIIKQNLLIGELQYAAQVALKSGRSTEALLIAEAGGQELFQQIKEEYFSLQKDSFVKEIIHAITKNDFSDIVDQVCAQNQAGPSYCNWKETLAYIIAYQDDQKLKEVAKELGDQLLKVKKDINSAIVCYILSNELDIVTDLWKKRALYQIKKQGVDKNEALFHLFQKTLMLRTACKAQQSNQDIDLILADFAEFLNVEQLQFLAMKYLQYSTSSKPEVTSVKNRIFYAHPELHGSFPKPQPAFQIEQIRPQPQINNPRQQNMATPGGQRGNQRQGMGGPQTIGNQQQPNRPGQGMNQPNQMQNQRAPQSAQSQRQPGPAMPNQNRPKVPQTPPVQQRMPAQQPQNNMGPPQMGQRPPQQQFNQMNNQGQPPQRLEPRSSQLPLDDSASANFGYNNEISRRVIVKETQSSEEPSPQIQQQQVQDQQRQNPVRANPNPRGPPAPGSLTPGLRPGTIGQTKPNVPSASQAKGPALPNMSKTQSNTPFNPADAQPRPQMPMSNLQANAIAGKNQGLRPGTIQKAPNPPSNAGPQTGMPPAQPQIPPQRQQPQMPPMQQNNPPQMPPMQNPNAPSSRAPGGGPPPQRSPMFAPPPMGGMGGQQAPPQGQSIPSPQQQPNTPPPMPPMGGGGPRSMAANMGPPRSGPPMGGGGPSADAGPPVNAQALSGSFNSLLSFYQQLEQNQKQKAETESKCNLMIERINAGQLQGPTMQKLETLAGLIEQSNHQGAQAAFRDLSQRCWGDVKDFSNALKNLSTFKQRYNQ